MWMQHPLPTRCCVVGPPMSHCATFVVWCCKKFEDGQNCCTVQNDATLFGRVVQHLLRERMRILSNFCAKTIETRSSICFLVHFIMAQTNVALEMLHLLATNPNLAVQERSTNVATNVASFGKGLNCFKMHIVPYFLSELHQNYSNTVKPRI